MYLNYQNNNKIVIFITNNEIKQLRKNELNNRK